MGLHMLAEHGQHAVTEEPMPDVNSPINDYITKRLERIEIATRGASVVLSLSRPRPWSYHSTLKYWRKVRLPYLPLGGAPEDDRAT